MGNKIIYKKYEKMLDLYATEYFTLNLREV